ncbi:hypothetical protein NA57DRAFT_51832 [Rhizodiscina lignyota]|uniref:Uncharacterized protein n=1 Tax=Rhizodiscina lignyota TaxID=1504668 RepID=A0A9P4IP36_9PEZI|nr:hypothetical protein NA57DRAFT_51832 [Rhizodiscina lignyota]
MYPAGYNVNDDFFDAIEWAKRLSNNYFVDLDDSAPSEIQELGQTIKSVKDRLEAFQKLKSTLRGETLRLESLETTLHECDAYLSKNSILQKRQVEENERLVWKSFRIWQTGRFDFEAKAKQFKAALQLEMSQLVVLCGKLVLTAKINTDVASLSVPAQSIQYHSDYPDVPRPKARHRAAHGHSQDSKAAEMEEALQELKALGYKFKRIETNAASKRRPADFGQIDEDLLRCWRKYCLSAGIPANEIPPISREEVLERPAQVRHKWIIEERTRSRREAITTFKYDSTDAPDSGHTATIDLHLYVNKRLSSYLAKNPHPELRDYEIAPINKGRKIHYIPPLEHDFHSPRQAHPYVFHHDTANSDGERRQVTFMNEEHRIVIERNGETLLDTYIPQPVYTFSRPAYQDFFLGDLRGETLFRGETLTRFDIRAIWSETTAGVHLCNLQVLFIWLAPDNDYKKHSLSFYASNKDPQEFLEFPICWFQAPLEKPKNTLELCFVEQTSTASHQRRGSKQTSSAVLGTSRRSLTSTIIRKMSVGNSKGIENIPTPPSTGPSIPPRSSPAGSEQAAMENRQPAPAGIVAKYGWVSIRFGNGTSMFECKKILEDALSPKEERLKPSFENPFPLLPSPAMSGSEKRTTPMLPALPDSGSFSEWASKFPS